MAQFNPKKVLRQVSKPLLRALFEQQEVSLPVDWDGVPTNLVDEIFDEWQRLPDVERKKIEAVFHDVHEMANEDGVCVIVEEGRYHGEDLSLDLEQMDSRHDKAVWTILNRPTIWKSSICFARADYLSLGRSWVKRANMPVAEPRTDPEGLRALEKALSAFYRDQQGRGHHCHVDHFPRGPYLDYYFVYLSDFADTHINFDESGDFHRTPERRAFEVVFSHDQDSSTLELYAKGGRKVTGPLQQIFTRVILGTDLDLADPDSRPYELDGLMNRSFGFPTDPADGIEEVALRSLRLSILGRKRGRITLEADPEKGQDHIYDMLEEDLNSKRLPRSILHVTQATINFKFGKNGHGRSLTFTVSHPNGCNLKSKRDHLRQLGEKYLKEWNIDVS